jgi:pimeloyl-ACP methyl ester carboxylesterase
MRDAKGLEYEVHGAGDPVLLIHGSHVADSFLPLVHEPALAGRFRLVRYHRRGFAGSAPHRGPFSIEQQARDALLPVQQLEIDRFHVVGHSYGAVTAIQLALDAPHAVQSLVLLEPPLRTASEARPDSELFAPLLALYRAGDRRGAVDAFMAIVGGPDWRATVERAVPGGSEQADRDAATFFEVEVPALQAWSFDPEKGRRLSQPALHVSGDASGALFERPRQLFMACVPHAEDVVLPGLNHLLQMQAPGLVARSIADFLVRHPL